MSAFTNFSSHLRDLSHHAQGGASSSSSSGAGLRSLQDANWSGQLAQPGTAQTLLGEALLNNLVVPGEVSALAVDPVQGYLAVGTSSGTVHLFGSPSVQLTWTLRPSQPVKFLLFKPGTPLLVCADSKENLSIYDLSRPDPTAQAKSNTTQARRGSVAQGGNYLQPHPDTPARIAAFVARNSITTLHLSPSHAHIFIGLRDGSVDTYDLTNLHPSPYRISNLWFEEEELLRKSGVPDAPPRRHVPMVVDLAISPKDLNILLLAYEGGAVLLDIKERVVIATFQLRLLPGAPGAGGIAPEAIWTERGSPATCVAWRPDGQAFAMGHEDGLISFWNPQDDSKPILVRSLTELDLDRPTVDDVPNRPPREPIFKMSWCGFPGKGWLDALSGDKKHEEVSLADIEAGTTILSVLGGAVAGNDPPGIALLNFAPYVAPTTVASSSFWGTSSHEQSPDLINKMRQSLRKSLFTTRESRLLSNGDVQDFVLLPRSSPHYCMAWDPCAIIALVDVPSGLPPLAPPAASRGLMAAVFPPLPPPGQHGSTASASTVPDLPTQTANPGPSPAPPADFLAPRALSLPFPLASCGAGAILGAELVTLSPHNYRRLIGTGPGQQDSTSDASASSDKTHLHHHHHQPPLPLKGGLAAAATVGNQSPEAVARTPGSNFRILMTRHLDGTIRFADASQHLLLAPSTGFQQKQANNADGSRPSDTFVPQFLDRDFPQPLPHLTISVTDTLRDASLSAHPKVARLTATPGQIRIASVHFATEILEVSVVLRGGLIAHYRFDNARFSQSEGLQDELRQEVQKDREDAEAAALNVVGAHRSPTSSSRSPDANLLQGREELGVGAALQNDMQSALEDLDIGRTTGDHGGVPASSPSMGSIGGAPPPRPKRDPKRSIRGRFLGGNKDEASAPPSPSPAAVRPPPVIAADPTMFISEEFTLLENLNDWSRDGFKAHLLIDLNRGDVTQLAHSDIGFLAIACGAGIALVDLRGPEVLARDGMGDDFAVSSSGNRGGAGSSSSKRRSERKLLEAESKAPITTLAWTVCRLPGANAPNHHVLAPRAIVGRANGLLTTWTLLHAFGMWIPERSGAVKVDELQMDTRQRENSTGLQILDIAGNRAAATPAELQRSIREFGRSTGAAEEGLESDTPLVFGWNGQTLFFRVGLLGSRFAKVDTTEPILAATIVERHLEKVVVAVSATSVRIYSAPSLELIQRVQRHGHGHGEQATTATHISIDGGSSGTFLEVLSTLDVRLWTLLGGAPRASQPSLLLYTGKAMPAHPGAGAVTSITSWFSTKAATTNALDDILGGPNRSSLQPPTLPDAKTKEDFVNAILNIQAPPVAPRQVSAQGQGRPPSASSSARGPHATAATVAETQDTAGTMGWNLDLARRRGEAMQGLENSLSALEKNANTWVKESKAAIVKSAAKDKLTKFGF